jgi:DNA-binding transcriptional MocR family regulator
LFLFGTLVERQFGEKWTAIVTVWTLISRLGDWQSRSGSLKLRLHDAVAELILSGELPEGSRLPSERHLSEAIAVSRNTVAATYALLTEEGLVEQRRGSGSVVRIDRLNPARIVRRSREVDAIYSPPQSDDASEPIDFCTASAGLLPEYASLIALDAREIARMTHENAYSPSGIPALREVIARSFSERGLPTDAHEILITNGGQQAIDLGIRLFVERGDSVAIESPTYFVGLDALRAAGARLHAIPGYERGPLRDMLIHANARMMYVIPTLQNPTSKTLSNDQRKSIAEAAAQLQLVVLEDATLEHLRYDGAVSPYLAEFARGGNIITIGSLNKEFWSGLRIGWMRADRATIARLTRLKTAADLTSSLWAQTVAIHVFERISEIRSARRSELQDRCRLVQRLLADHLPDWQYETPEGSLCLWIRLPIADTRPFVQVARRFGTRIISGNSMTVDETSASYIRIAFTADADVVERGILRLRDAWHAFTRFAPAQSQIEPPLAI